MIRKILVPVRGDGKGEGVFAHAAMLAKTAKAHVELTHCRPRPEDFLPYGIPVPGIMRKQLLDQANMLSDTEEAAMREKFEASAEAFGVKVVKKQTKSGPTAAWVEAEGKQVDVIKQHGRLADLIAVAKPDRDQNIGLNSLKAALLHTGRPVMMCPTETAPPADLGQNITIAWNGSTEAVRCVVMTRRLVQAAKKITILTVGDDGGPSGGEAFQDYLGHRDIQASLKALPKTSSIADALMEASADLGASVMLMGAYGESHEKEAVFGGNTQKVVDFAKMPVIMTH